jgi:hypothetical protein
MAERHDRSSRELGRRRVTAVSAGLLAAGVTGTVALAGWTAWAQTHDAGRSSATGTTTGQGQGAGQDRFDQGSQGRIDQGQQGQLDQGQQGGGFPQLGGSGGPGQAGSAGS